MVDGGVFLRLLDFGHASLLPHAPIAWPPPWGPPPSPPPLTPPTTTPPPTKHSSAAPASVQPGDRQEVRPTVLGQGVSGAQAVRGSGAVRVTGDTGCADSFKTAVGSLGAQSQSLSLSHAQVEVEVDGLDGSHVVSGGGGESVVGSVEDRRPRPSSATLAAWQHILPGPNPGDSSDGVVVVASAAGPHKTVWLDKAGVDGRGSKTASFKCLGRLCEQDEWAQVAGTEGLLVGFQPSSSSSSKPGHQAHQAHRADTARLGAAAGTLQQHSTSDLHGWCVPVAAAKKAPATAEGTTCPRAGAGEGGPAPAAGPAPSAMQVTAGVVPAMSAARGVPAPTKVAVWAHSGQGEIEVEVEVEEEPPTISRQGSLRRQRSRQGWGWGSGRVGQGSRAGSGRLWGQQGRSQQQQQAGGGQGGERGPVQVAQGVCGGMDPAWWVLCCVWVCVCVYLCGWGG